MSDLEALRRELEQFGDTNDAATTDRPRRMLNITRDTGEFLSVLVRATGATRILEVGTSNGYSTLWLAEAAQATGAHVTTIERSHAKAALARLNFDRSGLSSRIALVQDEAGHVLSGTADAAYNLIFLDSERTEYPGWWPDIRRVLAPGGLIVADNATSHPHEIAPFMALVSGDPMFTTSLVPVGKGEFMAVKAR